MDKKIRKYLLTVDAESGQTIKCEELGESGDLTEVSCTPPSGGVAASYVVNIFMGTGATAPAMTMVPSPPGFPPGPAGFPPGPSPLKAEPPGFPPGPAGFPPGPSKTPRKKGDDSSDDS